MSLPLQPPSRHQGSELPLHLHLELVEAHQGLSIPLDNNTRYTLRYRSLGHTTRIHRQAPEARAWHKARPPTTANLFLQRWISFSRGSTVILFPRLRPAAPPLSPPGRFPDLDSNMSASRGKTDTPALPARQPALLTLLLAVDKQRAANRKQHGPRVALFHQDRG